MIRIAAVLLLVAGCTASRPTAPATIALTEASIDLLPAATVDTGARVCLATGYDACPLHQAVANRVGDARIAIWEPGRSVAIYAPGDTVGTLLGDSSVASKFGTVVAITSIGRDRYRLVRFDGNWYTVDIDADGTVSKETPLTPPGMLAAIGYVGDKVVRQQMSSWTGDSAGRLSVTLLGRITDTVGTVLLDAPVPWLHGGRADLPPLPPLVAANPVWALAGNNDVVWSPGDRLMIERRSANGTVRWRVDGGVGPQVSESELDARESVVRENSVTLPLADVDFEEMRSRSDSLWPAVTGITVTPSDEVLVARSALPTADSVQFLRLGSDGQPLARFTLDRRTRILLAEGDSLLVHRPTEGEPWEVRWLRLR